MITTTMERLEVAPMAAVAGGLCPVAVPVRTVPGAPHAGAFGLRARALEGAKSLRKDWATQNRSLGITDPRTRFTRYLGSSTT